MIRDADHDDLALSVHGDTGMVRQVPPRILHAPIPVELLQVKLLYEFVLYRAARQNADEDVTGTLETKQITGDAPQTCTDARHRGSGGRKAGNGLIIWGHQARRRFVSGRD